LPGEGLQDARFTLPPADGSYFQCVIYEAKSSILESEFGQWRSAAIVRFCFAKPDETLRLALARPARP
jgi:methionine aminotransferase